MRFSTSLLAACGLVLPSGAAEADDPAVAFFEKRVRPVLVGKCYTCHSAATKPAGGLRVDDRNGLLDGGNSGPAVRPGEPANSLLLRRVTHKEAKQRMPKEGTPLSDAEVADLTVWIERGAAWPAPPLPAAVGRPRPGYEKLRREHWAWQPLTNPPVPLVRDTTWPGDAVDRFILARLETRGLRPVLTADRAMLLRRVTFDLTGLPPTPAQLDAFLGDDRPGAFERVVDGLLASPQFGERWGRHWLDLARYGESTGPSRNVPYPHAWRYRDYVIDSVNADVPFDRFIQEQVAGDLLPAASAAERDRLLVATGFLALGVKDVNQRFQVRFRMDNVDEQIDAVTRSVLALTVSCARCHDHKFDPVPQTDYYALAGIFTSTDLRAGLRNKMGGGGLDYYDPANLVRLSAQPPVPPAAQVAQLRARVAEARTAWEAIRDTPRGLKLGADGQPAQRAYRLQYERLQAELFTLTDPAARGPVAHGVSDAAAVAPTPLRIRGEAEALGPVVPRGFLTAFPVSGTMPVGRVGSGRLELARWLTSPHNPLTPRVLANRVWQRLFGQGLVTTVDNFGVTGDTPSHPELLDHLAGRLLRNGWSLKQLVRALVLTQTYRLGAAAPAACREVDPANRLLWRHGPRRLDAEELRDAMLAAAGRLNLSRPAGSPVHELKMIEMQDNGAEAQRLHQAADRSNRRSVYLPLVRGVPPRTLEAFDPVEQGLVTGRRDATTVPGQALYLLNAPFVRQQATALAATLPTTADAAPRVVAAYQRTRGRPPTVPEIERAQQFLTAYETAHRALPHSNDEDARTAAWAAFVQALFASAEFRYLR